MTSYLHQAIQDVTTAATSHQLASEHYRKFSIAIKYPQAIGPALVMIVSFMGAMFGGDDDVYYFYANQALSLMCIMTVAVDQYFGWTKLAANHANIATQYFQVRDRLTRLKRQQLVRAQSIEAIQPQVDKIEDTFMTLLQKHRRPPSSYEQQALQMMRSTQSMVEHINQRRRNSDSKERQHSLVDPISARFANNRNTPPSPSVVSRQIPDHRTVSFANIPTESTPLPPVKS